MIVMRDRTKALLLGVAAVLVSMGSLQAQQPASSLAQKCESFHPRLDEGVALSSVSVAPATNEKPARCSVRGTITTSQQSVIHFGVDLPDAGAWNSKLLFLGGGGFDGELPLDSPSYWQRLLPIFGPDASKLGAFVQASSDSGHQGRGAIPILDFSWAARNPDAVVNHADRANHLTLWLAVRLAEGFYGRAPQQRYLFGQSNGGRMGVMAAQRHPEDFNGIVSVATAISQEGFAANIAALMQHIYSRPENWLPPAARALVVQAQVDACDALDGVKDGIIANYAGCHFDPAQLLCPSNTTPDPAKCLTPGQVKSVRMMYEDRKADVQLADGVIGYDRYGIGSPLEEWYFLFGSSFEARDAIDYFLADNIVRVIADDPNASIMTHDPTKYRAAYLALSQQIDATDPDLSSFVAKGGKLIIWYGVGDLCVSINRTGEYVKNVEAKLGKEKTRSFLRFFASPSLGHGMNGAGANSVPALSAVENWVEAGKAPEKLTAEKLDSKGAVLFSRPLCEYGSYAHYEGKGDPNSAASFACVPSL